MGRKVLLAVLCWLTLSQTFGDKRTHSLPVNDNESAESAPRLYRSVPVGVYASAAPYGAHSFHLPTFIAAPKTAASQVYPVKEHYVNHLTDSYGNQFVGTPQLSSYKLSFPQQFIPLQAKLPEHLAQPLVAASANFQFKQSNGQFFGAPYRVPALQGPSPTPLHHFPNFGQLYGEKVKYLAPNSVIHSQGHGFPNTHQQPTQELKLQQKEPQIIIGKQKVPGVQEKTHSDPKFQKIQDASHPSKQQVPHHNHEEARFERVQEFPHYESKFQIIEAPSNSQQLQRIQEHRPSHGEVKFQRIQEAPSVAHAQHTYERLQEKPQNSNGKLQAAPAKQVVTYINDINGEKTIVELETKPNLPLLDLTLLEPLSFDNPLVPQVQHFLPRIHQATYQKLPELNLNKPVVKNYQKEFVVQKTMSYDNTGGHDKPHKAAPTKKQKKPIQPHKHSKKNDVPKKTTVTYHETLDDAPEITYEINSSNSPNYKETVKEKSVSYNMNTGSEPVHYTYGSKTENEPVTYSYSRTSNEPAQIKNAQYQGNGPSHLIYKFKPEEQAHQEKSYNSAPHHSDAHERNEKESSHESNEDEPLHRQHHGRTEQYTKQPQSTEELDEPVHVEKENHQKQNSETPQERPQEVVHDSSPKYNSEPAHFTTEDINFQPILKEYENNIRLLSPSASIKVDPHQHVQPKTTPQPHENNHEEPPQHHHQYPSPAPQEHSSSSPPEPEIHDQNHHHAPHSHAPYNSYHGPPAHIQEKSKRIIIQEEAPDEMHMLREQMRQEVIKREENSEEDFEQAYKDAAIGFPAYSQKLIDSEKDIFDPASYGVPRDNVEYDFDHTPLQQYQAEGDEFPKEARSNYKDARDKMKQSYYTDFSVSKPEGLLDRYQNKLGYYKLFKEQKPDYLVNFEKDDKKQKQKTAKYTIAPSYEFLPAQEKSNSYYGQPKPKQQLYEYDYSKGPPRDNSAFASRPYQSYKSRTSFVEPQFQYGFEPILLPKLLDSELAAMASNDSPESEKPGMRKKIYKENWYIKKTSTSAGAPAS